MHSRLIRRAMLAFTTGAALAATGTRPVGAQETPLPRPAGESRTAWFDNGQRAVTAAKRVRENARRAKNVILFVGDGMGVSTVTAARILEGQLRGVSGEENQLSFEKFPFVALSKTYQVNQQTSDSAPTMTSMVTGVKTEEGILGYDETIVHNDHTSATDANKLTTILEMCEERGMSTGIVSTARITHATPAACYAHSPNRDWEADSSLTPAAKTAGFPDIARQLIEFPFGDGIEVAFGGGREYFRPNTADDPEDAGRKGRRTDGRDLTSEWTTKFGASSRYVHDKTGFDAIDAATTTHALGLFERSHMEYEADRANDTGKEPSLTDMTDKAIRILEKNRKGFFLHVESGRIDHAHHGGNASRALQDTIEFAKAIRRAVELTDPKNTLIVVTADHSHVFTIAGYPTRGNPILGKVRGNIDGGATSPTFDTDMLGLPYTTLGYQNGPGYRAGDGRPDLTAVDTQAVGFLQEAAVPLSSETHAGEDVGIYAVGPSAHLFRGVIEQNVIFHVMADALRFKFDEKTK